jgi:hypothetical protein
VQLTHCNRQAVVVVVVVVVLLWLMMVLGNLVARSRGDVARHTLVTGVAPFRSPLRVRVERRHDLANMIGKMASVREEGRSRGGTALRLDLEVGSKSLKARALAIAENPAFRNGPKLIGSSHVLSKLALS